MVAASDAPHVKAMSQVIDGAGSWLCQAFLTDDGPVWLTSPYLSYGVCARLARAATQRSGPVVVVTTLNPIAAARGFLSVDGLGRLLQAGVEVRNVERLHAKCFIVGSRGMLGSANLTGAGLGTSAPANRELGVELTPADVKAARDAIQTWPWMDVTSAHLQQLKEKADQVPPGALLGDIGGAGPLSAEAEDILKDGSDTSRTLWLKLHYGDPTPARWSDIGWFASSKRGRPSITIGDLVVMCSKNSRDCYAVVEVTSEPVLQPGDYKKWADEHNPDSLERWPWVSRTKPRLVPEDVLPLKLEELGIRGRGTQNGHVRLTAAQFEAAVRALGVAGAG